MAVHRGQLEVTGIPVQFWKTLHDKLKNETYDAGLFFTMAKDEEGSLKVFVTSEDGIKVSDSTCVFLIDHAWTYQVNYARAQLKAVPGLADRMGSLMGLTNEETTISQEQLIDEIFEKMWSFNQSYHLKKTVYSYSDGQVYEKSMSDDDDEQYIPLWFVMDEFGSCIKHSDDPSFAVAIIHYVPLEVTFSVLWPLKDMDYGDEVTRDYSPDVKEPLMRECCLLPWFPEKVTDKEWIDKLSDETTLEFVRKELSAMQLKDWQAEVYPTPENMDPNASIPDSDKIYRVFTDVQHVKEFLTHPRFVLVDSREEADIIWTRQHFKDFRSLQESGQFINQFPNENSLVCKDLLAAVCQNATLPGNGKEDDLLKRGPEWLPVTFNLNFELPLFLHHYLKRKERGLDNHWICKPWNLARALDSHVTSNLNYMLRLRGTGPKVACKYIENPVLFHREDVGQVKFDIRYLVLISSAKPLVLHADKVFWLRFANQPFSLDSFDVYAKHFTVMNYKDSKNLKQVHHYEFIPMFEKQYPSHKWADIESKIFKMFREMFDAAVADTPPKTLLHCTQSRAFYAVDLMLKWADDGLNDIIPQVLEVNYGPDCERACRYHPNFFNYIFSLLFLGDSNGWPVEKLA